MTAAYVAVPAVAAFALGFVVVRLSVWPRSNYRSHAVSLGGGLVAVVVLLARASSVAWVVAVGLCGAVGVYDDLRGTAQARGLRGHLRAVRSGVVTSGFVKLVVVGLAGVVAGVLLHGLSWRALVAAVLVAGLANLVNLFDLRPGRALKVSLVVALAAAAWWVVGTAIGLLPWDARERLMLGDGGANAFGAAVGVAVAASASLLVASVAAAAVVALTLASERVSFTKVIESTPPLRWADRLGRAA